MAADYERLVYDARQLGRAAIGIAGMVWSVRSLLMLDLLSVGLGLLVVYACWLTGKMERDRYREQHPEHR